MVIASSNFGRRIPFGYLVEIKKQFLSRYDAESTDFAAMPPYGAGDFNGQLKKLMVGYGTTEGGKQDAITNVQQDIDNVRGIMTENIERVLERGERIDLLVDKTDRLGVGAHDFRVRSRGLKRRMWWKNMKLMVLLGVVIVFLIYLFVGFGCGLPGEYQFAFRRRAKNTDMIDRLVEMCGIEHQGLNMSCIRCSKALARLYSTTLAGVTQRNPHGGKFVSSTKEIISFHTNDNACVTTLFSLAHFPIPK